MTTCAWCEPNNHIGSHGICAKHAAEVLQQHKARKQQKNKQQQHGKGKP